MTNKQVVITSPFLVIVTNLATAYAFGSIIGKWAFIPMVVIGWTLWLFFILKFGGRKSLKKWLKKPYGSWGWGVLALMVGLIPLPLFLQHVETLAGWQVWLPWILLALINPWMEEFYWRGLLLDYLKSWPNWVSIVFTSILFAANHIAFGVNSEINSGFEVVVSTLIMGLIWAIVYKQTGSLRWAIVSHFLVDFFGLSAASFLDLFEKGGW